MSDERDVWLGAVLAALRGGRSVATAIAEADRLIEVMQERGLFDG